MCMGKKEDLENIADGIRTMRIRGAGRIARNAALGLRIFAEDYSGKDLKKFRKDLDAAAKLLLQNPSV